ncbi:hypothetical protein N7537_012264 [Penicillium hordei]|uniref:Uncharacterized protein n=1 Tax=Penicillium hordei TaxID=40994 RepID=A0AAD6DNF6_9EURO|nr:uncharacterized protein N7537_012264 [Penicillium hordei]KAJ5589586.1 hypothetical protein N7537_012264 [Penicillium hordei]
MTPVRWHLDGLKKDLSFLAKSANHAEGILRSPDCQHILNAARALEEGKYVARTLFAFMFIQQVKVMNRAHWGGGIFEVPANAVQGHE